MNATWNTPNLKTVPTNLIQAHLDRMKDSETFFAQLMAGEVLAGRHESAAELATRIPLLRMQREKIVDLHNAVNGIQP